MAAKAQPSFDPERFVVEKNGRKILPVHRRLEWLRSVYPKGRVETEILQYNPEAARIVMRAEVLDDDTDVLAKAHAMWDGSQTLSQMEDHLIARALGMAGFGAEYDAYEGEPNVLAAGRTVSTEAPKPHPVDIQYEPEPEDVPDVNVPEPTEDELDALLNGPSIEKGLSDKGTVVTGKDAKINEVARKRATSFVEFWQKKGVGSDVLLEALNVKKLGEWNWNEGGITLAHKRVNAHLAKKE